MMSYRIKRHRQRRHGANHFALIPFIDMMSILVVFLLAHTAEVDILPNTKITIMSIMGTMLRSSRPRW